MAIEDLDLEFEDEETSSGSDALEVDVDLSFSASAEENSKGVRVKPASKRAAPSKGDAVESPRIGRKSPTPKVSNINEARTRQRPQARPRPQQQPSPSYANEGSEDVKRLREEVEQLKAQMSKIQHQADLKIAVAEAEKEYLVEYVSNAKVLDHQVTQILQRISKKVPALGAEAQAIKKYMNDFVKKSLPKKKEGGDS